MGIYATDCSEIGLVFLKDSGTYMIIFFFFLAIPFMLL